MAQLSLTYPTVTDGVTVVSAVIHNTNWSECVTAVNNVDHTQIGAAGLYASQLLPTTAAQATFGATATGVGYTFLANDATAVPLTISGVTSQSADILDVTLTSGGTVAIAVNPSGALTFGKVSPGGISAAAIYGDNASVVGLNATIPSTSTNGFRWFLNNTNIAMQLTNGPTLYVVPATGSAVSAITGVVGGDIVAQRSASTGRFYAGGATHSGFLDYNVLNATAWSLQNESGYAAVFGGAYTNASDAALKTNIQPISDALSRITALTPVTFNLVADGSAGMGFTAQDVAAQFPDAVSTDANGVMGYQPAAVLAHLVAAFKEYVAAHP